MRIPQQLAASCGNRSENLMYIRVRLPTSSRTNERLLFFKTSMMSCRIKSLFFSRKSCKATTLSVKAGTDGTKHNARRTRQRPASHLNAVLDFAGVVHDAEGALAHLRHLVILVVLMLRVELGK